MFKDPYTIVHKYKHVTHDRLLLAAGFDPVTTALQKITLCDDWSDSPKSKPLALFEITVKGNYGKTTKGRK